MAVAPRVDALEPLFQRGDAQEAVVFEPGFAEHLARGLPARLLLITDATEPNTGSVVQAYATAVVAGLRARAAGARAPGVRIVPEVRMRFNPTRESSNLFVPGLMAFVLTIISSLMTAISLTREKETGSMEALLVSPLRPWQIIVGKVAPYLAVGFVSVVGVILEARLVFNVPLRGSVALLLAESVLFILVSLSLGILVSARTSSQRVAMMGAHGRHDAADHAAVRVHLPDREHAAAAADASRTSCRRAGSCSSRAASCSRASASRICGGRRWCWSRWRWSC